MQPTSPEKIIVGPHMTEKALRLQNEGKYTFKVHKEATKPKIKEAISEYYKVDVEKVRTIQVPQKPKSRRGVQEGHKPGYKKAMVSLKEGDSIEMLEYK